jgi:hypothetical protein
MRMAGKNGDKDDDTLDQEPEEVFTDLRGRPDPVDDDEVDTLETIDDEEIDEDETPADPEPEPEPEPDAETEAAPVVEPDTSAAEEHDLQLRAKDLEMAGLQAQMLDQQEAFAKRAKTDAEKALTTSTARLKTAKESGNTDDEIAVEQEILNHRDTIRDADTRLAQLEQGRGLIRRRLAEIGYDPQTKELARRTPAKDTADPNTARKTAAQPQGKFSKLGPQFLKANAWMADAKYADDALVLRALDKKLLSEGKLDMHTPAYFTELAARFNRVRPGLVKGLDGKLVATGSRERGNGSGKGAGVTPSATGGRGTASEEGADRLDNSDLRNMKRFGLDPNSKKHRAAYLREKKSASSHQSGRA